MRSGTRLVSWDTLNKVTVTGWPNVFNNDSQLLEHSDAISHVVPLSNDQVASLSGKQTYGQTLIISTHDGRVVRKTEVKDVIGLQALKNQIILLKGDGSVTDEQGNQVDLGLSDTIAFGADHAIGVNYDIDAGKIVGEVNVAKLI